jgi:hypothetical protein
VASARHLQHDRGEPVSHEVVDVAGYPAPLGENRLVGELTPGGAELRSQSLLTCHYAAHEPWEHDAHKPDPDFDLGRVLDDADRDRHRGGDQSQCEGHPEGRSPDPDDEGEQRDLERELLEVPVALRRHHRDRNSEGQHGQRKPPEKRPRGEDDSRNRGEDRIGRRPRIGDAGQDRDHDRKGREQQAQLVGLRPLRTRHTGTVLRQPRPDIPPRSGSGFPTVGGARLAD